MGYRFRHKLFIVQRIFLRSLYRLLGPVNVFLQPRKKFSIKAGYHEGKRVEIFDDRQNTDQWQRGVYEAALERFKIMDGKSVVDVGCGSAFKLMEMFGNYKTTGIELEETYQWLTKKYPSNKWLHFENAEAAQLETDLVICSDVIEHVGNPDRLMNFLKNIKFRCLVISTPERNQVRGENDYGPPENTTHFREWNDQEFKEYVSEWFIVGEQIISNDKSASQILFCLH